MKEERFFYTPDIDTSDLLPDEEMAHAIRVLRLGVGDKIWLMNGKGTFYEAEIMEITKKFCKFKIISSFLQKKTWRPYIHIAVAPTKNIDRIEWFVEKAVEIGVDEISIINTDFTERKNINLNRLDKIAISAMKQSRKPFKTIINNLQDFNSFVKNVAQNNRFICHCYEQNNNNELKNKILLKNCVNEIDDAVVIIGPEGDFSIREVLDAQKNKFIPVSLGDSRLRTETAALVALHIVNLLS